jgi:hypothetical protein
MALARFAKESTSAADFRHVTAHNFIQDPDTGMLL